jgi:hypothetical protein
MQALGARELVMDPIRGSHLGRRPMCRLYVGRTHASRRLVADSSNKTLAPRGPSTHAGIVAGVVGYNGDIRFDSSRPDGTPRKLLDVSRLAAIGWEARIGLEEGIRQVYQWLDHELT